MAIIDDMHAQRSHSGIVLKILFSFKTTKEFHQRSIQFGKCDKPADVAANLRRLADQIDDSEQLKKR